MTEKTKTKLLITTTVLFLIAVSTSVIFAIDNGALIEENSKAKELISTYEGTFNRYTQITECMDSTAQYELENEIYIKGQDIKNCVTAIQTSDQ